MQNPVKITNINPIFRLLDYIMHPLMWLFGGCVDDSIQETHTWHGQKIPNTLINDSLCVLVYGTEESKFKDFNFGLFHMPFIGGWKNYVVLECVDFKGSWYVGWKQGPVKDLRFGSYDYAEVNRLPIATSQIKLLAGPKGSSTYFFAMDTSGKQLPLKQVGQGRQGDKRFKTVRLF